MNDPQFSLGVLEAIWQEARRDDMTFAERAGLYAGARAVCSDFEAFIEQEMGDDSYALEKVSKYEWSIAAVLGFDITNGHDKDQHIVWARTAWKSLKDSLAEKGKLE